jgi:serine/alanine adding enzyme
MESVRVVRELDSGRWRRFLGEQPRANIFHTPEMYAVFEAAVGHTPDLWAVVEDAEVLALFTPVHVSVGGGKFPGFTTRSIAYGSVLAPETMRTSDAVHTLLRSYAADVRRASLFTELRNLHDVAGMQPSLEACGFEYEDHLNYLIDLDRPAEDIFGSISSGARKNLRRTLRKGEVTVSTVSDRSELVEWYELLQMTYRRARVPIPHPSLFEAAFDLLAPRDMIRFFLARVGSVSVACSAELLYEDTIYGWYGGCDRSFSRSIPNDVLMWRVLEWGANHGYRVYDFGGAGKPQDPYGVRTFKAKFGGELVNYGRNVRVHSRPRLAASKLAYRVYQAGHGPARHRGVAAGSADVPAMTPAKV